MKSSLIVLSRLFKTRYDQNCLKNKSLNAGMSTRALLFNGFLLDLISNVTKKDLVGILVLKSLTEKRIRRLALSVLS